MKKLLVVYELTQISALGRLLERYPEHTVFACGLDIEYALEEKGIRYESARSFRPTPTLDRFVWSQKEANALFDDSSMDFFSYKDLRLAELFTLTLQDYLAKLAYWIDIATVVTTQSLEEVVICSSTQGVGWAARELDVFELRAPLDAFSLTCAERNILCTVILLEAPSIHKKISRVYIDIFFWIANHFIMFMPSKKIKILASDYWHNLSPLLQELPDAELYLLDRSEINKMSLWNIFRNRARFIHSENYILRGISRTVSDKKTIYHEGWKMAQRQNNTLQTIEFKGVRLSTLITEVVGTVIKKGGPHAIRTVEGVYQMLKKLQPNIVTVRSSISPQIHFAVLCKVAAALGIPSIEIQHGALYLGPGSYTTRPTAQYMATYGPIVDGALRAVGYRGRFFDVGSPRFDVYLQNHGAATSDQVVCIAPQIMTGLWADTYDIFDYFEQLYNGITSASLRMTIKLRPGPDGADFSREAIRRICGSNCRVAQYESLVALFSEARAVVSCYSTAMLEALVSNCPVLYGALIPFQDAFGFEFKAYEKKNALSYVRTSAELGDALRALKDPEFLQKRLSATKEFMSQNYTFNGHASQTLADNIRRLIQN